MSPSKAWRRLGIAATTDVAAIRRAYAAKLKALDVDADRDGFESLRNAREYALQAARSESAFDDDAPAFADEDAGGGLATAVDHELASSAGSAPGRGRVDAFELDEGEAGDDDPASDTEYRDTRPWFPIGHDFGETINAEVEALGTLIGADDPETTLTDDEITRVMAHMDHILATPDAAQIDVQQDIEGWLVVLLSDAIPRSDPLLHRAAETFGWRRAADEVGQGWEIEAINARIDTLEFRAALANGTHRLSGAWRNLRKPFAPWRPKFTARLNWLRTGRIDTLLEEIRGRHPSLESDLNPARVAAWDHLLGGKISKLWLIFAIVQVILVIARCASGDFSDPPSNASAPANDSRPAPVASSTG